MNSKANRDLSQEVEEHRHRDRGRHSTDEEERSKREEMDKLS